MKKYMLAAILVGVGILIAFPLFSMTYYTMVRTSTPDFCASCHEIKPAVVAWRSSTHVNNPQGFVADCMDCHLPAPHKTFDFFFAKTFHGVKDVIKHFTIDEYDRQEEQGSRLRILRQRPVSEMPSQPAGDARQTRRHAGPPHRPESPPGIRERMRRLPLRSGSQRQPDGHVQTVPPTTLSGQGAEEFVAIFSGSTIDGLSTERSSDHEARQSVHRIGCAGRGSGACRFRIIGNRSAQLRQGQGIPHRAQPSPRGRGLHRVPQADQSRPVQRLGQQPPRQCQHHLPGLPSGPARRSGRGQGARPILRPQGPALRGGEIQGAHRHGGHPQGLFPVPSRRGDPIQPEQARQHHRDHVEAGPLAEQGHELGQRAQDRLLSLPRHGARHR